MVQLDHLQFVLQLLEFDRIGRRHPNYRLVTPQDLEIARDIAQRNGLVFSRNQPVNILELVDGPRSNQKVGQILETLRTFDQYDYPTPEASDESTLVGSDEGEQDPAVLDGVEEQNGYVEAPADPPPTAEQNAPPPPSWIYSTYSATPSSPQPPDPHHHRTGPSNRTPLRRPPLDVLLPGTPQDAPRGQPPDPRDRGPGSPGPQASDLGLVGGGAAALPRALPVLRDGHDGGRRAAVPAGHLLPRLLQAGEADGPRLRHGARGRDRGRGALGQVGAGTAARGGGAVGGGGLDVGGILFGLDDLREGAWVGCVA
ncbi:hypothetical protein PG991_010926 [Apiospora marii]|uniref:Uncharacterized protein n=1 Tax=Apiospora marii TaxID=335849 RepID=A0ABR1RD20_9PEZI